MWAEAQKLGREQRVTRDPLSASMHQKELRDGSSICPPHQKLLQRPGSAACLTLGSCGPCWGAEVATPTFGTPPQEECCCGAQSTLGSAGWHQGRCQQGQPAPRQHPHLKLLQGLLGASHLVKGHASVTSQHAGLRVDLQQAKTVWQALKLQQDDTSHEGRQCAPQLQHSSIGALE